MQSLCVAVNANFMSSSIAAYGHTWHLFHVNLEINVLKMKDISLIMHSPALAEDIDRTTRILGAHYEADDIQQVMSSC